jgi:glutamate racemase
MSDARAIGVFDSGVGGLTVARALEAALPDEQLIYLGDTARVPYGTKSADTVIRYSQQIARFLLAHHVKYIVVACNTASAHALDALRAALDVPLMGVIAPGARAAAQRTELGAVGVIGTLGTVASGAYQRALQALRPELVVFSQACPLFVPLAEEGWGDHPVTAEVARHYLTALQRESGVLDTLVLGCTHYPLLAEAIADAAREVFGREVDLVDSATATADDVARDLAEQTLEAPACADGAARPASRFFVTDHSRFDELATRFLGRRVDAEPAEL